MAKKFSKEKTINELNKRLGVRLFRLKEIGKHTKLTYGNKYVLNADITSREAVIYKGKEKTSENVYLTLRVYDIKEENSNFWLSNIKELVESLEYKRPLYKIWDTKNDLLLSSYGKCGDALLYKLTSYVRDHDGNIEGLGDVWGTDLKDKASKVVNMLNDKLNSPNRFYIYE